MAVCVRQPCICAGSIRLCAWILHLCGLKHQAQYTNFRAQTESASGLKLEKSRHMIPNRANEKTSCARVSCLWHRGNGRVLQTQGGLGLSYYVIWCTTTTRQPCNMVTIWISAQFEQDLPPESALKFYANHQTMISAGLWVVSVLIEITTSRPRWLEVMLAGFFLSRSPALPPLCWF
jgi:hypothetical protein